MFWRALAPCALLLALGLGLWFGADDAALRTFGRYLSLAAAGFGMLVLALWLVVLVPMHKRLTRNFPEVHRRHGRPAG